MSTPGDVRRAFRPPRPRRGTDAGRTVPVPPPAVAPLRRPRWERRYAHLLVVVDLTAVAIGSFGALLLRFGEQAESLRGVSYVALAALLVPCWIGVLALSRAYEPRHVGIGSEEFRRVFDSSVRLTAVVATTAFTFRLPLARGFVGIALPAGTVLLLGGRYGARRVLHHYRASGRALHRVLVVGDRAAVTAVARMALDAPYAGLLIVGACVPDHERDLVVGDVVIPALAAPVDAARVLRRVRADTVAIAGGWAIGADGVRRLAWQLEGSGVDLVVAPSLTNVAGPRITIRPVAGLPLLHVEEPELTGVRRVFKAVFDRTLALLVFAMAAPVMLAIAVAIKVTDRGPVLFSQDRVGRNGDVFRLWKFRSMYVDAEARRAELEAANESDGVLFKIRHDPRVTPVGRFLRRYSLDELPQILNVVLGDMSLVGPRPPLPSEVAGYESEVHRRLLVKPGVTGLWQVSGRADLSWEESVRLDLHYVENWSVALDFMILWKTVGAVIRGRGAY